MLNRRNAKNYGPALTSGRNLGNHMPRIASEDGDDELAEAAKQEQAQNTVAEAIPKAIPRALPTPTHMAKSLSLDATPTRGRPFDVTPTKVTPIDTTRILREPIYAISEKQEPRRIPDEKERVEARLAAEAKLNGSSASVSTQTNYRRPLPTPLSATLPHTISEELDLNAVEDVAGVPGRLRLSRNASAPPTPLKTRPISGLWADVQRHLIQAYEYLCHVGEAQQWIEGCLGEELSFGVVEMNEGLRNGVVLARLAQVWDPAAVRKIFDVSPNSSSGRPLF